MVLSKKAKNFFRDIDKMSQFLLLGVPNCPCICKNCRENKSI